MKKTGSGAPGGYICISATGRLNEGQKVHTINVRYLNTIWRGLIALKL